jgi:HEAT repeat protein
MKFILDNRKFYVLASCAFFNWQTMRCFHHATRNETFDHRGRRCKPLFSGREQFRFILICVALICVYLPAYDTCCFAQENSVASLREAYQKQNLERVLVTLKSPTELSGDATPFIPELIRDIASNDETTAQVAIRVLVKLKSKSSPAVPALCAKLANSSMAVRASIVDALVAIGDDSLGPVRTLLKSTSTGARSAAVETLGRLQKLSLVDCELLVKDPDSRVRAALAGGLSSLDRTVVPILTQLLADPEPAVSVVASSAIEVQHRDSATEIPALIQAASRRDAGWAAVRALGSYGREAQRALPAIFAAYSNNTSVRYFAEDVTETAVRHIGPPDAADIPALAKSLNLKEIRHRLLVLDTIALLGTKAGSATAAIEAAANDATEQYRQIQIMSTTRENDPSKDDGLSDLGVFIEKCIDTVWVITHDSKGFLQQFENAAIKLGKSAYPDWDSPWPKLPEDSIPILEKMLQHNNRHVQLGTMRGVARMGHLAAPMQIQLLKFSVHEDEEYREAALTALYASGLGLNQKDISATLLAYLRSGRIPLVTFAKLAKSFSATAPEVQAQLETGLNPKDRKAGDDILTAACARALGHLSKEPHRVGPLIISAANTGPLPNRSAVEALRFLKSRDVPTIEFMIKHLDPVDRGASLEAIDGLSEIGEPAKVALPEIEKLMSQDFDFRLKAARAIWKITGQFAPLQKQLKERVVKHQEVHFYELNSALKTIGELKKAGSPFLSDVADLLRTPYCRDAAAKALVQIGTPEALKVLDEASKSSDFALQSVVKNALQQAQTQSDK